MQFLPIMSVAAINESWSASIVNLYALSSQNGNTSPFLLPKHKRNSDDPHILVPQPTSSKANSHPCMYLTIFVPSKAVLTTFRLQSRPPSLLSFATVSDPELTPFPTLASIGNARSSTRPRAALRGRFQMLSFLLRATCSPLDPLPCTPAETRW